MKPSVEYLQERFSQFNDIYFGGGLPTAKIRVTNAKTYMGNCRCKSKIVGLKRVYFDFVISISARLDLPEQEVEDTLLHEMIHLQIFSSGVRDTSTHGQLFRTKMAQINATGRHLTISHKATEAERVMDTTLRQHIICVTTLKDGTIGVTVCAQTKALSIKRRLPFYYRIVSSQWYLSTDPFFNSLPRSRTPKIYRVPADELQKHLATATPLEWHLGRLSPIE